VTEEEQALAALEGAGTGAGAAVPGVYQDGYLTRYGQDGYRDDPFCGGTTDKLRFLTR
jgi:hypothetical protein